MTFKYLFSILGYDIQYQKSCLGETLILSLHEDSSTNIKTNKKGEKRRKKHVMCHVSCVECHISCVRSHVSHVMCRVSPVANVNRHSHRPSPCYLPHNALCNFKQKKIIFSPPGSRVSVMAHTHN